MSKRDKLVDRFKAHPSDFTWDELLTLLRHFGYEIKQGNGSRVRFVDAQNNKIVLHKPHPGNILKGYLVKEINQLLMEHGKYG